MEITRTRNVTCCLSLINNNNKNSTKSNSPVVLCKCDTQWQRRSFLSSPWARWNIGTKIGTKKFVAVVSGCPNYDNKKYDGHFSSVA